MFSKLLNTASFGSILILVGFAAGCHTVKTESSDELRVSYEVLYDSSRQRQIPVAYYHPKNINKSPLVVLSHGYGENAPDSYKSYTFLAEKLTAKGMFVVSIQHELPTDSLIPKQGIPQIVRRPIWERGAANIGFVINHLRRTQAGVNFNDITLIGHSNGGDMSTLFVDQNPNMISRLVTLDHRRYALPRVKSPKILSIRSNDQVADEGVLPTAAEQSSLGIKIIKLDNVGHSDMSDGGTSKQKADMLAIVLGWW